MQIIAHRGVHEGKPGAENTLLAFSKAVALGFGMLELDARLTKGNQLIVSHDPEIRHRGRKVVFREHPLWEMVEDGICVADGPKSGQSKLVPTLELALDIFLEQVRINVELKEKGAGQAFIDLLKSMSGRYFPFQSGEILKRLLVSSFEDSEIRAVKKAFPEIETAYLMKNFQFPLFHVDKKKLEYLWQMGIEGVHLPYHRVSKGVVQYLKSQYGFAVRVYTVNDHTNLYNCLHCGADAVFTDKPEMFKAHSQSVSV